MSFLLPKTYRADRKAAERRQVRRFQLTRAQVRTLVYDRAKGTCERCGRRVDFGAPPFADEHAEVNEPQTRAKGADPLDPKQCELVCHRCHFGGPSRAHAPTKARMVKR